MKIYIEIIKNCNFLNKKASKTVLSSCSEKRYITEKKTLTAANLPGQQKMP
jgi:hypothetical protein